MRAEMKGCFAVKKLCFFKGVCVPRPSAIGPYPRPSTLDLLSVGHVVGPWPPKYCNSKFMNKAFYLFKIIPTQD